jgi:MFS-type transporter involved in bile tolerance (Atg22 family)
MKYADNVKKTHCQTVAIVGTAIGSVLLDDFDATPAAIIGMIIVLLAVYLYSAGGNLANKFAKTKSSIERA